MYSVTEVIDYLTEPELLSWMLRVGKKKAQDISSEAMRIGTVVDRLVQEDIHKLNPLLPFPHAQTPPIPSSPEITWKLFTSDLAITNCLKAWELFKKAHPEFVPSIKEMQTELVEGELVGHPDFIHETGITDLKCSSGIRPKHWTQVAKYGAMKFGFPKSIAILRLDKVTGLYEYKEITDETYIQYEIEIFEAYRKAYLHNFKNREMIRQQLEKEII